MNRSALTIIVLISGNGTNLQAIIDAINHGLPVKILAVISNQAQAFGLQRAQQANIPTVVISHQDYPSREAFDAAMIKVIDSYAPKLVVLAGFMRKLSAHFVQHYHHRLINIHPALLPKHKGMNTHRAVLTAGDSEHGVSVHYVTEEVDSGPIICQAKLQVGPEDTEASLTARVHELEHIVYPQVLAWMAAGRITLQDHTVHFDHKPLPKTGRLM
jgi:phosphoribosylglycinamide formyltransferase-1